MTGARIAGHPVHPMLVGIPIGLCTFSVFADLIRLFDGDLKLALASYNAGENRVVRWKAERPGLDQDEFIDDIPFPETQNYVKKVLGTAEDYRRLYGKSLVTGGSPTPSKPAAKKPPPTTKRKPRR